MSDIVDVRELTAPKRRRAIIHQGAGELIKPRLPRALIRQFRSRPDPEGRIDLIIAGAFWSPVDVA